MRPSRILPALILLLAGCGGVQSALTPAGTDAQRIADLWWWMAGGAALVWVAVIGTAVYAIAVSPEAHSERKARWLIIGGGAVFPTVVLTVLLLYGLPMMPELLEPGREDAVRLEVSGEEWWWRVRYHLPDGRTVESANEIHLPVGVRTEVTLRSPDVIHSFWIPAIAGKIDMIPGRTTRLALEPTRTGTFRGQCAEYCGTSHAWMSLVAVVHEPEAFRRWLESEAGPAPPSGEGAAARGGELFLVHGCAACHTVRGTPADGRVGPDLTRVGGRWSIGAGVLPNDSAGFREWLVGPGAVKPGVHMPSYDMLPPADLSAMAAYLEGLR